MKIAIYTHSLPPAVDGVSRRFSSIIHELHKAGHEVVIFTLERDPHLERILFPESEGRPKFRYIVLDSEFPALYPSKKVGCPTTRSIFRIFQALWREKPDYIHVTVDGMTLVFCLAALLFRVPCVGSIHTDVQTALRSVNAPPIALFLTNFKERMESLLLDGCATTSLSFRAKLRQQGISCDHVVKTAVLVDKFRPEAFCAATRSRLTFGAENAFLVVYVGRLAPEKGLDTLVTIAQSVDNLYLALIGDGPLGGYLSSLHGANSRIYCRPGFLGHDELPRIYASADAHATCSLFETLGNTVLEAHACGVPVVVPRTQGFVDTVSDGVDGFLFPPGRPAEGARALAALRDDAALRRRMGLAGRAKVLEQSPALVTRDIIGWYERSAARMSATSAVREMVRGLQLFGMVLLLLFVWHAYALPAALAHQLCLARKTTRALLSTALARSRTMLQDSSVFARISQTYRTLSVSGDVASGRPRRRGE